VIHEARRTHGSFDRVVGSITSSRRGPACVPPTALVIPTRARPVASSLTSLNTPLEWQAALDSGVVR
jgi:hypothetical protein